MRRGRGRRQGSSRARGPGRPDRGSLRRAQGAPAGPPRPAPVPARFAAGEAAAAHVRRPGRARPSAVGARGRRPGARQRHGPPQPPRRSGRARLLGRLTQALYAPGLARPRALLPVPPSCASLRRSRRQRGAARARMEGRPSVGGPLPSPADAHHKRHGSRAGTRTWGSPRQAGAAAAA